MFVKQERLYQEERDAENKRLAALTKHKAMLDAADPEALTQAAAGFSIRGCFAHLKLKANFQKLTSKVGKVTCKVGGTASEVLTQF